jgi:23S rRNA G2445 N2-methylase RlmL
LPSGDETRAGHRDIVSPPLALVALCAAGLEPFLADELRGLGADGVEAQRGAVAFRGGWAECWRANWRLRTANRVLWELASFPAPDGDALYAGARALLTERGDLANLLSPERTFAIDATATDAAVRDAQWAALRVKDGLVDAQRERHGRRASVERAQPDLPLRLRLHRETATLLLDTSGEPLDRRGYRGKTTLAPVREQLAAACVLASGWDGSGPVVDPMCGSGTLLVEAAWIALGIAPAALRSGFAFERLPSFDAAGFAAVRAETIPAPGPDVTLVGNDVSSEAVRAARENLTRAGLEDHARVRRGEAFTLPAPEGAPGLVLVNPPYGARLPDGDDPWRQLGDWLKRGFRGWRAVVLAGGETLGRTIGLKPNRRWPVKNGALEARILVFELY